jgi:hypothetical protein
MNKIEMKKLFLQTCVLCALTIAVNAYGAAVSSNPDSLKTPTLGAQSLYILTPASSAGINTITKYLQNADNTVTPVLLDMTYRTAGDSPDPSVYNYYFKWVADANGNTKLQTETVPADADISVYLTSQAPARITTVAPGSDIQENFVGLTYADTSSAEQGGGAISSTSGSIGALTSNFVGNSVTTSAGLFQATGGAIFNALGAQIGSITGNFINNYVYTTNNNSNGGAIHNRDAGTRMGDINGSFIGNYASATGSNSAYGGAISNVAAAVIGNINGDFINNYAYSVSTGAVGANTANAGAIYVNSTSVIGNITGDFIGNYAYAYNAVYGGAIYILDTAKIGSITGDFINNYAHSINAAAYGGAINNGSLTGSSIGNITGDFAGNSVSGKTGAYGGAIYNTSLPVIVTDGSFVNNYAQSTAGPALGGAIYTTKTIDLIAKSKDVILSGNYVSSDGGATKISNAVHLAGNATAANAASLNLNADAGLSIIFNDSITSDAVGNSLININNDGSGSAARGPVAGAPTTGTVLLNADMSGFGAGAGDAVNFWNGTIKLGSNFQYFAVPIDVMAGGSQTLDISNNSFLDVVQMNKFTLDNNLNVLMDVNLANKTSDTFTGTPGGSGTMNLTGFNILKDSKPGVQTDILIADAAAMGYITLDPSAETVYSPLYQYAVTYDDTTGILSFLGSGTIFNPDVFRGSAATLAAYRQQLLVNDNLFDHVFFDSNVMLAGNKKNDYRFIPSQFLRENRRENIWFKSYYENGRLPLTQDINLKNNMYGYIMGLDFTASDAGADAYFLPTLLAGYSGAQQSYQNVNMRQNALQLGFMASYIKNDYTASGLIYAGAYQNSMSAAGHKDDVDNHFAGVAVKNAYNIYLDNFVLQPNALVSYNFYGAQSWTSSYGDTAMETGSLNGFAAAPGLNLIYGLKTWNFMLNSSYVINAGGGVSGKAGGADLPELKAGNGYFEYGAGASKIFSQRLSVWTKAIFKTNHGTDYGVRLGAGWMF